MTQQQLGEAADTTGNVISQLESGVRGLSHKWLLKLAPILGTRPGILLDHDPNTLDSAYLKGHSPPRPPDADPPTPTDRVVRILKDVSKERQQAIAVAVEALAGTGTTNR